MGDGKLPWWKAYPIERSAKALALADSLKRPNAWIHVAALRYWLGEHASNGIITGPNARGIIERAACWDGESGVFFQAAIAAGFLREVHGDDGQSYWDDDWRKQNATHVAKIEADRGRPDGRRRSRKSHTEPDELPADTGRDDTKSRQTPEGLPTDSRSGDEGDSEIPKDSRQTPDREFRGKSRELRVESRDRREEKDHSPPPATVPLFDDTDWPAGVRRASPRDLQKLWNQHAHPSLPRWVSEGGERDRNAAARLLERPLLAEWRDLIERVNASAFCRGEVKEWKAHPGWFVRPGVAGQIIEGRYDDAPAKRSADAEQDYIAELFDETPTGSGG